MYLLYGLEKYLIDSEIKKICEKTDDLCITKYDLEETNIEDIIDDALTVSLFNSKKIIIINNAYIFSTTNKKLKEQNLKKLEEYFEHLNKDTIMIFVLLKDKIDPRKKITSLMKEKGKIIEFNKILNLNKYVSDMFKPYIISPSLINLFVSIVGSNLDIISLEIDKIKIYKNDDLNITENDILQLATKNIDMDIFKLIDNILLKNKSKAIECLEEMIKYGEEPLTIIVMVANQFRIMYQSKCLIKKGYSEHDISLLLEIHEYRVKKALEKARKYSDEILLNNLEKLADLDLEIKSGKIDKNIGLEMFLINL